MIENLIYPLLTHSDNKTILKYIFVMDLLYTVSLQVRSFWSIPDLFKSKEYFYTTF